MDAERPMPEVETSEEPTPRGRRKRPVKRSLTLAIKGTTRADVACMKSEPYPEGIDRPVVREDCLSGSNAQRPCPWAGCRYHLAIDVSDIGSIKVNNPSKEIWEMSESCALDVADRGGLTLEAVGAVTNRTRERVRQLEGAALEAIGEDMVTIGLANGIEPSMRDRRGSLTDCVQCGAEFRREAMEYAAHCNPCKAGKSRPKPSTEVALPTVSREEQLAKARAAGQARGPAPGSMAYEAMESKR